MKADQERVKTLLTDTVTLLCKNGLQFSEELKVQGLLGITLDNKDVFVVHINEIFSGLIGTQVSNIHAEGTSAIAAADSATSDSNLKLKNVSVPKYNTSSPTGSAKRKSRTQTSSLAIKVKKEVLDDDLVILDSKCFDHGEFNTDDLSGDGDREAMRKSYGEISHTERSVHPPKWRVPDSASESFLDSQSQMCGTLGTGLVKSGETNVTECDNALGNSSVDGSQLPGMGQLPSEGQIVYENTPGCSGWETQGPGPSQVTTGESGSQDSLVTKLGGGGGGGGGDSMTWRAPQRACAEPALATPPETGRRPATASQAKPFKCQVAGCRKAYYFSQDLRRHERFKHGRASRPRLRSLPVGRPQPAAAGAWAAAAGPRLAAARPTRSVTCVQ